MNDDVIARNIEVSFSRLLKSELSLKGNTLLRETDTIPKDTERIIKVNDLLFVYSSLTVYHNYIEYELDRFEGFLQLFPTAFDYIKITDQLSVCHE